MMANSLAMLLVLVLTGFEFTTFKKDRKRFRLLAFIPLAIITLLNTELLINMPIWSNYLLRIIGSSIISVLFYFEYKQRISEKDK